MHPTLCDSKTKKKVAKLLRLLCDRSSDGETLAAANRLRALVDLNDLDWDALLEGGAPDLTRAQLQKVYAAGIAAGVQMERDARGEVDSRDAGTPRGGEVGSRARELKLLLAAADEAIDEGELRGWFAEFARSMMDRYRQWGPTTYVSEKQWGCLDRLRRELEYLRYL